jgi:hypothetical protein
MLRWLSSVFFKISMFTAKWLSIELLSIQFNARHKQELHATAQHYQTLSE